MVRKAFFGHAFYTLIRDRQGRLVVGGRYDDAVVLRFTANGRLDRGFGRRGRVEFRLGLVPGVKLISSTAYHLAIDRRGRIVVAGNSYTEDIVFPGNDGDPYPAVARLLG